MHTSALLGDPKRSDPKTDARQDTPPSTSPVSDRSARLIALLDSFEDGDPEQQRQDFDTLRTGLDAARPGQRRLFGEDVTP